jgi:outer membrane protein assembly factor BamB
MNGVAPHGDPPVEWSEAAQVRWKVEIPGQGSSTPIIWGDTILLQTAIPVGEELTSHQELQDWQRDGTEIYADQTYVPASRSQQFALLALDRRTGQTRWQRSLREEHPHEGIHPTNTWASASPVTDGEHIFAFFGSRGLYALDMAGRLVWEKDLGDMETRNGWGEGSSPALFGETLVVNWDHEGKSFLTAFDKRTGRELWRQQRDERSTWFTPLVIPHDGRAQVITTGAEHVRGYDLKTGELLWSGPGLTFNAIPTPVAGGGTVYVTSGFRGNALLAIRLDRARGEIDGTEAIVWQHDRDTPYVASPLLYDDTLYFTKHLGGIFTSLRAHSGELIYGPVRLPEISRIFASPVAAAARIYIAGRDGRTVVLKHGPELEVLAVNRLDDGFDASPAIVGNELYLRGRRYLYRISED